MIGEWIKLSLASSCSLFGVYIVFGMTMNGLEQLNAQAIMRTFGYVGIVVTGFIGTVVHEFSHYVMCLAFGHQVIEVSWFRPVEAMSDGVLGYVYHSYAPNSIYQQIGNFFIGIAPLLLGSMFILLLFHICLPRSAKTFTDQMNANMQKVSSHFSVGSIIKMMFIQTGCLFKSLFNKENMKKPIFWIFLFAMYSISTHMSLSMADLQGAAAGLGVLLTAVVIISFIFALLRLPVKKCAGWLIKYNAFIISIFSIGLSFSLLTLGISALFDILI